MDTPAFPTHTSNGMTLQQHYAGQTMAAIVGARVANGFTVQGLLRNRELRSEMVELSNKLARELAASQS